MHAQRINGNWTSISVISRMVDFPPALSEFEIRILGGAVLELRKILICPMFQPTETKFTDFGKEADNQFRTAGQGCQRLRETIRRIGQQSRVFHLACHRNRLPSILFTAKRLRIKAGGRVSHTPGKRPAQFFPTRRRTGRAIQREANVATRPIDHPPLTSSEESIQGRPACHSLAHTIGRGTRWELPSKAAGAKSPPRPRPQKDRSGKSFRSCAG
jgi:hypothetical protein